MSKIDSPPAYEDSLHSPKHGNYPQHPQYGYLGYGGAPVPPPPAYSPGPAVCPGQPAYSAHTDIYPGAGMGAGPGFPPPGMSTIIPTLSAGVPTSNQGNMEDYVSAQWESTSVRHAFIRKVYFILAIQLSVTISIVAVFTFVDPVRLFVIRNPGIYWASFVVYFIVYCILICCKEPRRRFPWNILLLAVFTLSMSYMTGTIASYYETKAVFLAIGITAIVCVSVTVFCFQTKVDFTSCGGVLCILGVLVFITGIITAVVLSFQYVPWLHMLYAAIGAVVYTLFLAYNTQLLIGNRELGISPEEYIFGALSLYIDIVQIFLFILQIGGAATE